MDAKCKRLKFNRKAIRVKHRHRAEDLANNGNSNNIEEPVVNQHTVVNNYEAARTAAIKNWERCSFVHRITSLMWSMDSFDPFQIFEVSQRKCHILTVQVLRGKGITKGWVKDFVDTPDPYLVLSIAGTPNGKKRTRTIDNCVNPTWNETFVFLMDPVDVNQLELVLMDANYTLDEEMGRRAIALDDLKFNIPVEKVAEFENGSRVFFTLEVKEDINPDLRYSLALSSDEKEFLKARRERVMEVINRLLGAEGNLQHPQEVPVIGLLGSGGGFRAMTAMSGVCHALHDEGILDCLMYMAGLSGSTWYLSFLYSHPDFPLRSPGDLKPELRDAVGKNWLHLLTPSGMWKYSNAILSKMKGGQPVSFTDLFGHLVGDTLLGSRKNNTLTDQRRCLVDGAAPLPLYTCLNVKKNVSARVFQDWIEFSPYEVGVAKYGSFMKPQHFNNKFYVGKILKEFPECPLHFLQGIWGSAFCILFKRLLKDGSASTKNKDIAEMIRDKNNEELEATEEMARDFKVEDVGKECFESGSSDEEFEAHSSDDSFTDSGSTAHSSREQKTPPVNKQRGKLQRRLAFARDTDDSDDSLTSSTDSSKTSRKNRGRAAWREKRRVTRKAKVDKQSGFWHSAMESLFSSSILDTRAGRAGLVFNPLRGLNLNSTFPLSPFDPTTAEDDVDFKGFYEATELRAKKLYLVDSGLTFNIPFPLLLRPQRAVDLYLSFDFSARASDDSPPFKEILLAEQWAKLNHVPFPPVSEMAATYEKQPVREWYIFEDTNDPYCPVILHFIIYNGKFKQFKSPGVPRETKEEKDFADFAIFSDPETPYSIYNFCYTAKEFDRMADLMEFNVRLGTPAIKTEILRAVRRKQNLLPKLPVTLSGVQRLSTRVKNKSMLAKLRNFVVRSMSIASGTYDDIAQNDGAIMNESSDKEYDSEVEGIENGDSESMTEGGRK